MVDHFTARGGQIMMNARVKDIVLNPDGSVKHYALTNGQTVEGDFYMSAMPGELSEHKPARLYLIASVCRPDSFFLLPQLP
jgi:phytoene dehydrogenase-like protein